MRSKFLMLFFGVVTLLSVNQTNVLGQNPPNEKSFDSIRTVIIKNTCKAFSYTDKGKLKMLDDNRIESVWAFIGGLKIDPADSSVVTAVNKLGTIETYDSNAENNRRKATELLDKAVKACDESNKDTGWAADIRVAIDRIGIEEDAATVSGNNSRVTIAKIKTNTGNKKTRDEEICPSCKKNKKECKCDEEKGSPIAPIGLGVIIVLGVGYFIYRKNKNASPDNKKVISPNNTVETKKKENVPPHPQKPVDKKEMAPPHTSKSSQVLPHDVEESVPIIKHGNEWVLVGASVKGNGHIQSNMPCQDNHKYETLGNGWGIAVVSDGAGSAEHSELGSKVVAERGVFHFKTLIEKEGWMKNNVLPTDVEWLQKSYYTLKNIRNEVELVAQKNNVELRSLSATCLVVIYSPIGLLATHVGDGRMGYKSASGEWRAMMTPHKGDEANQTIFLVSDFWSIPNYVMSGVLVPESIVVREPVKAFALMSDGCENTSWKCTTLNPETGKYFDQNKPFEGFFNPLEETLFSFHKENVPEEERKAKWYKFIESGTSGFVKEQDDKTMIYGVNVN